MEPGIPQTKSEWIEEIAEAYRDAKEAMAFAFCYLASHFALDLVDEQEVNEIMEYMEAHRKELAEAISNKV